MTENDKALHDQREQTQQLAAQALMTMEKFMAMNKNNLEANEECLDLMAKTGTSVINELFEAQSRSTQRSAQRLEDIQGHFAVAMIRSKEINEEAEKNVKTIVGTLGDASKISASQQETFFTEQVSVLTDLKDSVKELSDAIQHRSRANARENQ